MDIPDHLLAPGIEWAAQLLFWPLLLWAALTAPWSRVTERRRSHVYLGGCVSTLVLWQIRAGLPPGPYLHLLGATLLTLMFGWRLALVALGAVLFGTTLNGAGGWWSFGVNGLIMGALPVLISDRTRELIQRRAGAGPFAYVFGCGFGGAALSMATVCLASAALVATGSSLDAGEVLRGFLPYELLLVFPEAFITGSLVAWLTMFYPEWVATFGGGGSAER